MINNINGISNLDDHTEPEYPASKNGQTFSIKGGFEFTLSFDTTEANDNGFYCLVQLVTESYRSLENDNLLQTSVFDKLPVLDGDVMEAQELWYSWGTIKKIDHAGSHKIILPDNPQTSPADEFYGPPTALDVKENFVIIFAKYLGDGNYAQIEKWTWDYSDKSNKNGTAWQEGNFQQNFQLGGMKIDLSSFNGEKRANNEVITSVNKKNP